MRPMVVWRGQGVAAIHFLSALQRWRCCHSWLLIENEILQGLHLLLTRLPQVDSMSAGNGHKTRTRLLSTCERGRGWRLSLAGAAAPLTACQQAVDVRLKEAFEHMCEAQGLAAEPGGRGGAGAAALPGLVGAARHAQQPARARPRGRGAPRAGAGVTLPYPNLTYPTLPYPSPTAFSSAGTRPRRTACWRGRDPTAGSGRIVSKPGRV